MLSIGCHLSSAKGYRAMAEKAAEMGADTFQFFTRNPRGGSAKPLNEQDLRAMTTFMEDRGFTKIIAHAPYTLNPCSADPAVREFAVRVMTEDLALTERIPNAFYNIHPGSHGGQGVETGIEETVHCLNEALHSDQKTEVLLETMSGKGNEIGSSFEEIAEIIHRTKQNEHLGVCFDTCHVFSSGYDIREALESVLLQFDRTIGLAKLKAVHLNDSKTAFASRRDRHEKLGQGSLGLQAIARIVTHPLLDGLPFILETPNEINGYIEEISLVHHFAEEEDVSNHGR